MDSGWILIEEKLPDYGKYVLIEYYPFSPIMEGTMIGIDKRIDVKGTVIEKDRVHHNRLKNNNYFTKSGKVIAWQPLPQRLMAYKPQIKPID